jgi:hypothetical protein
VVREIVHVDLDDDEFDRKSLMRVFVVVVV